MACKLPSPLPEGKPRSFACTPAPLTAGRAWSLPRKAGGSGLQEEGEDHSDTNSTKRKLGNAAYSLHTTSEGTRWTRIGVGFTYKNGGILYDATPHGHGVVPPFQRRP